MRTILLLLFLISCGKKENTFPLVASCRWAPHYGECRLLNSTNKKISCDYNSVATTVSGFQIKYSQKVFLYEGMSAWNWARAINPWVDPIVTMYGVAKCSDVQ